MSEGRSRLRAAFSYLSYARAVRADLSHTDLEPAPCDTCLRAPMCARDKLACTAFERFNAGLRWQISPRNDASREAFERIFPRGS